jgi:KamA family protein
MRHFSVRKFKAYTRESIRLSEHWNGIPLEQREAIDVVGRVLPFRVNQYVMDELIDWDRVPDDPIFRLTFPHRDMLNHDEYEALRMAIAVGAPDETLQSKIRSIRLRMNPHPAGQMTHNVPYFNGGRLAGVQHKYAETILFFPASGQTCHAYCTFCFRWPQFVGMNELKFDARTSDQLVEYLKVHTDVTDVLITGGDPLVMNARSLAGYIRPLLIPELSHIQNIRIGTKSVAYWPQRFVVDSDADELLRLFEEVVRTGRHLALMGHYNHAKELTPEIAQTAVRRIVATGATVRIQAPLIRHINEDPRSWAELWKTGVKLGAIPYYMFVERDTGPSDYFKLPLVRAHEIFRQAYQMVSGLARTVRGPSMSALPGKVMIDGIAEIAGEKVFALQFLQARNPDWVRRPFYAKLDPEATWFDELKPAFGEDKFFFQKETSDGSGLVPFRRPSAFHESLQGISPPDSEWAASASI